MSVMQALRVFHQRRIALPIAEDALVLDVGSGDKPSWRADVLLDRYLGDEYAAQRSGRGRARVSRPLFNADAVAMPFADGVFDYTICSNLLEHVVDPAGVVQELMRVSRAGYIEVPEASSAKIVDFPSHIWWCRLDPGTDPPTLVLTAKTAPDFDPEIARYLRRSGLERRVESVLNSRFEHRVVMLHWTGTIPHRVEGAVPDSLVAHAMAQPPHTKDLQATLIQVLTDAVTVRKQRRLRRRALRYDDLVRPEFRLGNGALLERRIYSDSRWTPAAPADQYGS
ncbi:methyltransferase domain-containing protein [Blastococcus montanus]|uniref:class I SAM-dependent methyltransferase n=1 Tax=Blastococcus montanus TaxID=3144973 RepID=UPI003207E7DC